MKRIWSMSVPHHTVKSVTKSRSNIMCRRAPILCNPVPLSGQRGMMPMELESDLSFSYCFLLRIRIASTDAMVSTTLNVRPSSRISGQGEGATSSSRGLLHIMVAMREMIRTKRRMKIDILILNSRQKRIKSRTELWIYTRGGTTLDRHEIGTQRKVNQIRDV